MILIFIQGISFNLPYTCEEFHLMRASLLVIGIFIISRASLCQSNFVITAKGDTLYGDVKILSYDLVDRVQLIADKKKKSFTALEAKAVFLNNVMYHSVRHDSRYHFMLLKQSGYLSLYGFRLDNQITYDGRLLVKRDGEAMEVPNLTFKKMMQEFLKDCMSVSDKIKNGELSKKDMDTIINLYNTCIEENTKLAAQVQASSSTSNLATPAIENIKYKIENSSLSSKQDVLDLVNDIETKLKGSQPLPNYLLDGLKGYLSDTEFKPDLDRLIESLKSKE
jgi:hypothetical protein